MTNPDGVFAAGRVGGETLVGRAALSGRPQPAETVPRSGGGTRAWPWIPGRELAFWTLHLGFWAVVFCLLLLTAAVYRPQFGESPLVLGARVTACLVATAAMRRLANLPQLFQRLNVTRAGLVAGGLLTSAAGITLAFGVVDGVFTGAAGEMPRSRLTVDLADNATLLASWCAVYFGFQLIQERSTAQFRAVEAEAAALRTELHRLQSQISPHFLFNALNTVLASRDDPAAIETITQALANYLRFLLRPAAPLGEKGAGHQIWGGWASGFCILPGFGGWHDFSPAAFFHARRGLPAWAGGPQEGRTVRQPRPAGLSPKQDRGLPDRGPQSPSHRDGDEQRRCPRSRSAARGERGPNPRSRAAGRGIRSTRRPDSFGLPQPVAMDQRNRGVVNL